MTNRPGKPYLLHILLLILLISIAACSSVQHSPPQQSRVPHAAGSVDMRDLARVKEKLLQQYKEWYRTPYKMGGLSRSGIDCSGFAYLTFSRTLGYTIPRTTDAQVQIGTGVARGSLRVGDLIFFHTSIFYNHVGIYLGDSQFLHASTSKGVMISTLTQRYWDDRYWTARRLSD